MKKGLFSVYLGLFLLCIIILLVLFAPYVTSQDPLQTENKNRLQGISKEHPMGTDNYGRDIFARLLYGGRITLSLAFIAMLATGVLGIFVGITSALFYGSFLDVLLMRTVDVLLALPFLVLAMAISTFFGRGLDKLIFVVIVMGWASFARLSRSLSLSLLHHNSLIAAQVLGASRLHIVFREILPRIFFPMVINITMELSGIILSLSTLSFFGMGSKPPTPEWGSMLSDGRLYLSKSLHLLLWPCLAVFLTVFSLNLIGEGLRDYSNPYELISLE